MIHTNSEEGSISISYTEEGKFGLSVASADKIFSGRLWYISRVNVREEQRGKGIGSKILQTLIEEIKSRQDKNDIVVYPGGYNEDPEKQFAFYKKNGFIDGNNPGMLIYVLDK